MAPGSVVVDLAAERGGNCELTRPDEIVVHKGVTILGPINPPADPFHASQMYSKNITTFLCISWARTVRARRRSSSSPMTRSRVRPC